MAALAACLLCAAPAAAETVTGTATVRILQAITVAKTGDLNFGKVISAANAGAVGVALDGSRTCGTGLTCFGTTSAGNFVVTGSPGETVTLALDSGIALLTNGYGQSMNVALALSTAAISLPSTGSGSFTVGGTLSVGANQQAGTYAGRYSISVNYQ